MPLSVGLGKCLLAFDAGFSNITVIGPLRVLDDLVPGVHPARLAPPS